jgi:hypothetical protein
MRWREAEMDDRPKLAALSVFARVVDTGCAAAGADRVEVYG